MEPGQLQCRDRIVIPQRLTVRGYFVREGTTGTVVCVWKDIAGEEVDNVVLDEKNVMLPFRPAEVQKL